MAAERPKHLVTTALALASPACLVLIALVAGGYLRAGPALLGALAGIVLLAILVARPLRRLDALRRIAERIASGGDHAETGDISGAGPVGELGAALQRLERGWVRDRQTLQERLNAAGLLFDALPDPLVTLDRHSRLVYANAAARRLLAEDRPDAQLSGRDLSSVLRQPAVLEAVAEVLGGADTRAVEFTFTDRVDQTFEARVETISDTTVDDDDAQALLLLRDVTALRRSEQMRADFVANVSHELRTPLTSLIGFIETLRGPALEDAPARERFLELMETQSSRMARLVNDLLSLSRIEMHEHTPPDKAVDLRQLLATIIDLLAPQAHERDITLELDTDALDGPVRGDADQLTQLFQNLIENAIKYGRPGTKVRIAGSGDAETVTVGVTDQGEGIAREHLPRLTERFYRVDTARSRELGGTGLGLAIVKHIVNRHRGDLKIDSEVGTGSTFWVSLRRQPPT